MKNRGFKAISSFYRSESGVAVAVAAALGKKTQNTPICPMYGRTWPGSSLTLTFWQQGSR